MVQGDTLEIDQPLNYWQVGLCSSCCLEAQTTLEKQVKSIAAGTQCRSITRIYHF